MVQLPRLWDIRIYYELARRGEKVFNIGHRFSLKL